MRFSHPLNTTVTNFFQAEREGGGIVITSYASASPHRPYLYNTSLNLVKIVIAVYRKGMREETGNKQTNKLTNLLSNLSTLKGYGEDYTGCY